mgnify:CR=1 FL=1|tara:strand:+ start:147 stop:422 length:276 start_codon:yes stop_codon:yes gene_type:complete
MKTFKEFREVSEGIKTAIGLSLLAAPFLAKKFLKPKTDKMLDKQRKTNKIGGDRRSGNTDFQSGVNAIKGAKNRGGILNKSTYDALNNPDF